MAIQSIRESGPATDRVDAVDTVGLRALIGMTSGSPDVRIAVIDGPVAVDHPDLTSERLRFVGPAKSCAPASAACMHGTFVVGILAARRGGAVPAICPDCTIVLRPIFSDDRDSQRGATAVPSATSAELAWAIIDVVDCGVRLINVSAAVTPSTSEDDDFLRQALDLAAARGAVVFAAAGDQAVMGGSPLVSHQGVIPVVAYSRDARPLGRSNLGRSIGLAGVGAPGDAVISLASCGGTVTLSGSSAAVPFVTGAAGLLAALVPSASAAQIGLAIRQSAGPRSRRVCPRQFDAGRAHALLRAVAGREGSDNG